MPPPVRHQETQSFIKERIRLQVVPVLDLLDDHAANERASPGVCEHRPVGRVGGIEKTEADTEPLMQDFAFDTQATLFSGDEPLRKGQRGPAPAIATPQSIERRVDAIDWTHASAELDAHGCATLAGLLSAEVCDALRALYPRDDLYRSRVVMARHGFGRGEYKYFDYPLPDVVGAFRTTVYPRLAPLANAWNEAMRIDTRFPPTHADFLRLCHQAGQSRPTPLILQYTAGDYNCLHQDLYGEHVFPLQLAILLSEPGKDFTGGEFVLTEQRPRMQSRAEVVPLRKGDAVIFAVHHRPVQGTRGAYCVNMRHGVSRLRSGHRHTLGVIFHDAK